ncbi:MAG: hypothetical protein NTV49_03435 [Kiritimatiellaeota bacterium]|nr:hypothetical protein [Kiritimatiellota bacterium]
MAEHLTLGEMAKALNRSPLYVGGLQKRFELPALKGATYSPAYLAFLQAVIALRTLNIAEETLLRLWKIERALLRLLHVDSTGSPTWFLNACGPTTRRKRRLLLSNYDMGVNVPAKKIQLGLDFDEKRKELFAGKDMGEDALRLLNTYLDLYGRIRAVVRGELTRVRGATRWAVGVQMDRNTSARSAGGLGACGSSTANGRAAAVADGGGGAEKAAAWFGPICRGC